MNRETIRSFISYGILTPLALLFQFVYLKTTRTLDLGLVLACSAGWLNPLPISAVIGFGIGFIQDMFIGRVVGFSAFVLTVVSTIMSWMRQFLNPSMLFSGSIAASIATGAGDCTAYMLIYFMDLPFDSGFFIREILPYSMAWPFVLIVPVNFLIKGLLNILCIVLPDETKTKIGGIDHESRL